MELLKALIFIAIGCILAIKREQVVAYIKSIIEKVRLSFASQNDHFAQKDDKPKKADVDNKIPDYDILGTEYDLTSKERRNLINSALLNWQIVEKNLFEESKDSKKEKSDENVVSSETTFVDQNGEPLDLNALNYVKHYDKDDINLMDRELTRKRPTKKVEPKNQPEEKVETTKSQYDSIIQPPADESDELFDRIVSRLQGQH